MEELNMHQEFSNLKIDKKAFSVVSLSDQSDDREYWFARDPIDRFPLSRE